MNRRLKDKTMQVKKKYTDQRQITRFIFYCHVILFIILYGITPNFYLVINLSDIERSPDKKIGHLKRMIAYLYKIKKESF